MHTCSSSASLAAQLLGQGQRAGGRLAHGRPGEAPVRRLAL